MIYRYRFVSRTSSRYRVVSKTVNIKFHVMTVEKYNKWYFGKINVKRLFINSIELSLQTFDNWKGDILHNVDGCRFSNGVK